MLKIVNKIIFSITIAIFLIASGNLAIAGVPYTAIYWVDGKILPPTDGAKVSTNDRIVILYETTTEAGYADDFSGPSGLSGRSGEFMMNAMEDWRMEIKPGKYKISVAKGSDNYGVDPTDITITGKGYDTAPNLVLAKGAGITPPGTKPFNPPLAGEVPVIESIKFNNRLYQPKLIDNKYEFIVSNQPKIDVKVTAGNIGIDTSTLSILLDEGTANEDNIPIMEDNITTKVGENNPVEVDYTLNFVDEAKTLTYGKHTLEFFAGNSIGTTSEIAVVSALSGDVKIIGEVLAYPSPIHLSIDEKVTLQYGLSTNADIDIYIFDITAKIVKKLSFTAGSQGGSAGGTANPNKVEWNLMSDQGYKIGSGIYIWNIVDKNKSKIIGKGKLTTAP